MFGRSRAAVAVLAVASLGLAGCGGVANPDAAAAPAKPAADSPSTAAAPPAAAPNLYSEQTAGKLQPFLKDLPPRVYVPNSNTNTVTVIDPATFKVVDTFSTGKAPQHVVPSYDLKTLWVNNNGGNSLTAIDPLTSKPVRTVQVKDPYNMYYSPDGAYAIVVQEELRTLQFLDAGSMQPSFAIKVPDCKGMNHIDFTPDGRYALASCEFNGRLAKIDLQERKDVGTIDLGVPGGMPQDVRLSADGKTFYIADMVAGGVHLVTAEPFAKTGFLPTGVGTHGLYPSRDGTKLYVVNRGSTSVYGKPKGAGSISVLDFATNKVEATWEIPGGGSPDMGNVSVDGSQLWLAGRYDNVVYALDTATGKVLATIGVGPGPHGLAYWPQPGRFSLGHTGNMR